MSRLQKAFYLFISVCFVGALLVFLWNCRIFFEEGEDKSLLKALPLYRFLKQEREAPVQDEGTYEKILAANRKYLKEKVLAENEEPEITDNMYSEQGNAAEKEAKEEDMSQENPSDSTAGEQATEEESSEEAKEKEQGITDETREQFQEELAREAAAIPQPTLDLSPEALSDYNYLLGQFFIMDPNTATGPQQLNAQTFLGMDLSVPVNASAPQILIYHSHSQEGFVDSDLSNPDDRVVGVGSYLTYLLEEKYGYQVIHVTEEFDVIDGQVDRAAAYDMSQAYVEQVLAENPSIEVVIDLHRDGVPEDRHLVTEINGKPTAKIMNFNGLSYTTANGPVDYLPNPYIEDNLAFSFQLIYQAAQYYPDLYRGIYLAGLRYNLQLRPRALLLEAGAQTNTVQEVKNAMEPFADILNRVLQGQ
ncbi:MAG: stage II sporulation protein P [Eubacteriales bacterium]|nr:stage II sporulation protein P [Eubacteriales bacterium]